MSLKTVIKSIKKNRRFVITAHINLEGDALGCELAFYSLLKKLGKQATILNSDETPYNYNFLPNIDIIKKYKKNIKHFKFDSLVILDCSDLNRTGEVCRVNTENKPIINIDHHVSNRRFGQVNWVEPCASCCAEMIYRLYKKMRIAIDKNIALYLYVGMLTDTGSFHYSNTNSLVHKATAEFLKHNLDVSAIYKNIYEDIPFSDMKLLTKILPEIKRDAKGRIIWFQIKQNMLRNRKLSFDISEYVLSFGRAIKGADVVVLFKENFGTRGEIRVNFRSVGKVDVNAVASYFGGGGHKTASGATVKGDLEQVRRKVLAKIKEYLK